VTSGTAPSPGVAAVVAMAALALACTGRAPEFDGIGRWRFAHTTLQDVREDPTGGRCQPTELRDGRKATWCFALAPIKLKTLPAEVDLYFLGTEPTARLIEIQLKIRGCREGELEQWLRGAFGPPIQTRDARGYWKNSVLWLAARMPSEPGRCLVHVLPLSENAEIERIKQE